MNLWIRNQDRNVLLVINTVGVAENDRKSIVGFEIDGKVKVTLGDYKTEERALEVLDEIQSKIDVFNKFVNEFKDMFKNFFVPPVFVYEMPKE